MLTLEDVERKDFSKEAMVDEETSEGTGGRENYDKSKYQIATEQILNAALLSTENDDDMESQENDESSELLSIENDSELTNESTISDWDNLKMESPLSCINSVPNAKEFFLITQLQSDNALMTKKLSSKHSLSNKKSKSHHRSKRHNKVLLLRKLLPKHEPIVEIKEEENSIISTEMDDHISSMEEIDYGEPCMDDDIDSKDNVVRVQNVKPMPLYYAEDGKPYLKCPACGAIFFTSNTFEKHLYTHAYEEDDTFVCSFCNYTNTEPGMLFAHLSKHQNQCEFCNENLSRKNNFEKHWDIRESTFTMKRDHQGRFVCSVCKLVFDLLPQLEKHWLKHACRRERTYQCKECSGLYESRETLKSHKCMKCAVCGKVYDSLHRLKTHTMWTKHNLKCPICSYEFILAIDHEKHLALHRQTFSSRSDYLHCLQTADGKTFQCNLCDKIFYALPSLVSHLGEDHDVQNVRQGAQNEDGCNDEIKGDDSISDTLLRQLKEQTAHYTNRNSNINMSKIKIEFQDAL
ncbi:PREDICTED: zinc finger and BTB domain-containing protein 41-like [Dufourea novaeangliae]|uniref:zinc finger and BTB domain-containing protein 41-like n=1 Tax=Dufourea novaeangliae TaxID=178035 RepID=UPI000766FFDD|nr:PREDICTED: zinc finger and BTB domain-containing protein 41-like [Dufourea novaeangliae]XP_015438607.1 PREDICTED: zinc finger and BTB domain-containing protein 41-like [Dufourea novaeangliae]